MTKTVYHPTLDSRREVPDSAVESWKNAGWLTKRPAHITSTEPAGQVQYPVVVDNTARDLQVEVQDNTATPTPETAKPIS